MCIIVAKPKGKSLPSKEILKNCFMNNNDGAGFSFVKGNRVFLSKGYGKWKPFIGAVRKFIKEDTPAILHFRIASIGSVCEANCHPFVMTEDKREIDKTVNCTRSPVFAHNGSFPISATKKGKSDTRQYARVVGDPVIRDNIFRNDNLLKMLANSIGFSKLAFMNRHGELRLLGDFEEEEGIFFSNHTYNYRKTVYKTEWEKKREERLRKEEEERKGRRKGIKEYREGYNDYSYADNYFGSERLNRIEEERLNKEAVERMEKEDEEEKKNVITIEKLFEKQIEKEKEETDKQKEKAEDVKDEVSTAKKAITKLLAKRSEVDKCYSTNSPCEICGEEETSAKTKKEREVHYYPKIDSSICLFCWNLYFGGFEEEVVDKE